MHDDDYIERGSRVWGRWLWAGAIVSFVGGLTALAAGVPVWIAVPVALLAQFGMSKHGERKYDRIVARGWYEQFGKRHPRYGHLYPEKPREQRQGGVA